MVSDPIALPPSADASLAQPRPRKRPSNPALSDREVEVMLAWILSDSKSDVCHKLFIAPGTINTHLSRIREKYHRAGRPAPTKATLLARALQDGYLCLDDL